MKLNEYLAKNGNITVDEEVLDKLLKVEHKQGEMPKLGEEYWSINTVGRVYCVHWHNTNEDTYRYYSLNCFKSKKEAEKAKEAQLMHGKLMRYAEEHNENRLTPKYFHFYYYSNNALWRDWTSEPKENNKPYFTSEKLLSDAIESVGGKSEILRVLYGVETKEQ